MFYPALSLQKSGAESRLVAMAAILLPLSRAEPGCLRYDFLQDTLNPSRFVFFELWKTRKDLNEHFQRSYFKNFAADFPALIVGEAEILTYEAPAAVPAF